MKYTSLLLLMLISLNLTGQDLVNPFYQDTITVMTKKCHEEIARANDDFAKNSFVLELLKPIPFSDTQQRLLNDQYGIQTVYKNGLISPNYDCYNFRLKTLTKERLGFDVLKYTKRLADSLDGAGLGDRSVRHKIKVDIIQFLKTHLSSQAKKQIKNIEGVKILFLKIDISEDGYAINATIDNTLHQGQLEIEILSVLKEEELWLPETDNGKRITSSIIYTIDIKDF